MTQLVDALYLFSTVLLVPVVIGLFLLILYSLLELGGLLREWGERMSIRNDWQARQRTLASDPMSFSKSPDAKPPYPGLVAVFANRIVKDDCQPLFVEKHVHDLEIESSGRLARLSLLIRLGPMLGLMGTLIPLGPALIGLSESNLAAMAEDLIVAFSTTVLGLLVGGLTYAIWLVRRQWYAQDLADIEFLLQALTSRDNQASVSVDAGDAR